MDKFEKFYSKYETSIFAQAEGMIKINGDGISSIKNIELLDGSKELVLRSIENNVTSELVMFEILDSNEENVILMLIDLAEKANYDTESLLEAIDCNSSDLPDYELR